jgi:hypothetical protein
VDEAQQHSKAKTRRGSEARRPQAPALGDHDPGAGAVGFDAHLEIRQHDSEEARGAFERHRRGVGGSDDAAAEELEGARRDRRREEPKASSRIPPTTAL